MNEAINSLLRNEAEERMARVRNAAAEDTEAARRQLEAVLALALTRDGAGPEPQPRRRQPSEADR